MNINRLLAGTLALVLFAGLGSPAFAQDNVIFDNGGEAEAQPTSTHNMNGFIAAEDFIIDFDFEITDFHFVARDPTPENFDTVYEYFVFEDGGGEPGDLIVSGDAQSVVLGDRSEFTRFVWFDLEDPVQLKANTLYWFGLQVTGASGSVGWVFGSEGFGSQTLQFRFDPFNAWDNFNNNHGWFLITGNPTKVVGGELLPIDNTALLLAGLQTSAIWMLPVLAGVTGSAFGVLYIKSRRN